MNRNPHYHNNDYLYHFLIFKHLVVYRTCLLAPQDGVISHYTAMQTFDREKTDVFHHAIYFLLASLSLVKMRVDVSVFGGYGSPMYHDSWTTKADLSDFLSFQTTDSLINLPGNFIPTIHNVLLTVLI